MVRSRLGRFISPDTLIPDAANPQSLDRFAYVFNNPLMYTDPSGHCPECLLGAILGYYANTTDIWGGNYRKEIEYASSVNGVPPLMVAASIDGQYAVSPILWAGWEERQYNGWVPLVKKGGKTTMGIGQLSQEEIQLYVDPSCSDYECASSNEMQIKGMAAKIGTANKDLDARLKARGNSISETDRWMVMSITQNEGPGFIDQFFSNGRDWDTIFKDPIKGQAWFVESDRTFGFVKMLIDKGWAVPPGVDIDAWERIMEKYREYYK